MSNSVPKLLLLAVLSLSAGSVMADNWRNECGKMAATIPAACTEIEKTVAVLDVYKPPQPFIQTVLQTYTPGSAGGTTSGGTGGGGSILLDPTTAPGSTQEQSQDSGTW